MLTLSRKKNESIVLLLPDGREIVVTVLERGRGSSNAVRIGIAAPKDIPIFRPENRNEFLSNKPIIKGAQPS
jgi:carbon storage regulator CsrA